LYIGLHVKYPSFLSDVKETLIFSRYLSKYTQLTNLMKIRPVLSELSQMEGQTDGRTESHDEANRRFSQFCNRV